MSAAQRSVIQSLQHHWAATYCKGKHVMYIGCGKGDVCAILAEYAASVMGVDSSHSSIEMAKNAGMPANVSFKVVVDGTLPFEESSFDVIIFPNQIERAFAPKDLLKKIVRILKPEGQLIISTVNRLLRLYFWQKPYEAKHFQEYSPVSFKKLLSEYFVDVDLMGLQLAKENPPNTTGSIQMHKFKHGVLHPLKAILLKLLRSTIGFVIPLGPPPREEKRSVTSDGALSGIHQTEKQTLQEALEQLLFVKDHVDKCTDMLAICRKSEIHER